MKPWVLIIAALLHIHLCSGQDTFNCLRDLDDYNQFGWDALIPELRPKYAETVADLPSDFHGKLEEAEGILYYAGSDFPADATIANSPSGLVAPVYLYIKYYAHQGSSASQAIAYVTPALVPDDGLSKNLVKADDYVWREEVVDIDPLQASTAQIASGMIAPEVGDFFLVDTMIIAYGSMMDMEQIKSLCPRKISTTNPTTTTTEMSTTTVATTTEMSTTTVTTTTSVPTTTMPTTTTTDATATTTTTDATTTTTTDASTTTTTTDATTKTPTTATSDATTTTTTDVTTTTTTSDATTTTTTDASTIATTTDASTTTTTDASTTTTTDATTTTPATATTDATTATTTDATTTTTTTTDATTTTPTTTTNDATTTMPTTTTNDATTTTPTTTIRDSSISTATVSSPTSYTTATSSSELTPPDSTLPDGYYPEDDGIQPYAIALITFFSFFLLLLLITLYLLLTRRRRRKYQDLGSDSESIIPTHIPISSVNPSANSESKGQNGNVRRSVDPYSNAGATGDPSYISSASYLTVPGADLVNRRISNLSRASNRSLYTGITNDQWAIPRLVRKE